MDMLRGVRDECIKIFGQKKVYVVIVGHLLLLLLCYIAFRTTRLGHLQQNIQEHSWLQMKDIFAYVDGLFFARAAMIPTFFIIFPIYIATVAGDMVAGDVQEGTLKLYASRDRSRTAILLTKLLAVFVVALITALYFAAANLLVGTIFFGTCHTQLVYMRDLGADTGLILMTWWGAFQCYLMSIGYFAVSIMALGTATLFFSTVFNRMTTATVAGITVYFVCYIVAAMPFAQMLRPYLISTAMTNVSNFWLERIPWGRMVDNFCLLGLYVTVFTALALVTFNYKDIR